MAAKLQALRYQLLGGALPKIDASGIAVMGAGQFLHGSKARSELGFDAEVSADEAIRRALNWFRGSGYING